MRDDESKNPHVQLFIYTVRVRKKSPCHDIHLRVFGNGTEGGTKTIKPDDAIVTYCLTSSQTCCIDLQASTATGRHFH